jgi:prepilin-type N-terminal cleavage/methylation domain-containing protein
MRSANKGFTLVELIVVIAIIAILASVSIVGYNQFIQNARDSRAETELSVIQRQVEAHFYVEDLNYAAADYGILDVDALVGYENGAFSVELVYDSVEATEALVLNALLVAINDALAVELNATNEFVNPIAVEDEEGATGLLVSVDVTAFGETNEAWAITSVYEVANGTATWTPTISVTNTPPE